MVRKIIYYEPKKDIDNSLANKIINSGYEFVPNYVARKIKRKKEISSDFDYIEKTSSGEVEVSFKEYNRLVEKTRTGMETFNYTLFVYITGILSSTFTWLSLDNNSSDYYFYKKAKTKLKKIENSTKNKFNF